MSSIKAAARCGFQQRTAYSRGWPLLQFCQFRKCPVTNNYWYFSLVIVYDMNIEILGIVSNFQVFISAGSFMRKFVQIIVDHADHDDRTHNFCSIKYHFVRSNACLLSYNIMEEGLVKFCSIKIIEQTNFVRSYVFLLDHVIGDRPYK